MVSPKKVHVETTQNFTLQKIAQAVIKLMSQKWYKGHVRQLTFCEAFGQGWVLNNYFLIDTVFEVG
jgi:hypothetical protein